jgi:hypothetical protein
MERTDGIFEDLLNIEVNTIVKYSMTAEKMPPLPFALLDIVSDYGSALAELRVDLEPYFAKSREQCWTEMVGTPCEITARENFAIVHGASKQPAEGELLDYVNDLWPVLEAKDKQPRPLAPAAIKFSMAEMDNGWDTFERLRIAALEAAEHVKDGNDHVMLNRIVGSCARLKYMLQGLQQRPPLPRKASRARPSTPTEHADEPAEYATLSELIPKSRNQLLSAGLRHKRIPRLLKSDDLTLVRKTWEVGVDHVLMQTCVQIDGDVVTRISQELLRDGANSKRELVMEAHKRSVEIGLSHWRALVQVAVELVGDAFRKLVG